MTMMRDTSAIAEPTAWTDDPRSTPNHWADVRRTVEPDDDPSNPAAVRGIVGTSLSLRRVVRLVEIVDLPLDLQPKLLRVLEEQEFERVGSAHTIRSDVRIIAATNRPLEELVEAGAFRADLYYRLNVFPIDVPALRERPEDIPLLVRHFVAHHARSLGRRIESIPPDVMERLLRHPWPGNLRLPAPAPPRPRIPPPGASRPP